MLDSLKIDAYYELGELTDGERVALIEQQRMKDVFFGVIQTVEHEMVSECCGAKVINHDERGQGKCADCFDSCEEVETE